ncbi:MAG: outer membrane beta-barrel protein [Candidatus Zixiibacteriota bacterium]|nr:MAG: outer membrane beta-barrel protein [candidate division Zixibacteria bacterium]
MNRSCHVLKLFRGCLVLPLLVLLTVGAEVSKAAKVRQFDVGLRAGLSLASLGGENGDMYENSRTGLLGGGFVRYRVSNLVSLETDVSYLRKGGKGEMLVADYKTNEITTAENVLVLNRVVVTPALVFTLPVKGQIRPSLLGGVSVAFAGSSQIEVEGFEPVDISEYTKSTIVGYVVGVELAYHLESTRVFIDLRYSRDTGDFFEPESFEWISQIMSIGFGVGFEI